MPSINFLYAGLTLALTFLSMFMPINSAPAPTTKTLNFDDIVVTDPLLHFQHMPQYADLAWPGMYISQLGFNLPGGQPLGITPHSGSQCAVAIPRLAAALNPFQQNGNNNLLGLDLLNPLKQNILQNAFVTASANMTADYFFSPVKSFDLKSFWFACSLSSLEAVVSLPQACSVDVYGWKAGAPATGFPSAVATFVFFGNNFLKAGMTQATLSATFSGLGTVSFVRRKIGPLDAAIENLLIDDINYVSYPR